ncbi:MAG TPA: HipA family kinase [Pirellulales bacterium]|jgi:hypothetical protein|nr:HipA family kinase [Pirellulales bacterium]
MRWHATVIKRFNQSYPSSACTAQVVTDAGIGYLKALESPEGRHILACEFVGTCLAEWFHLPTFDHTVIEVDAEVIEIPFFDRNNKQVGKASNGPAFITRGEAGDSWSGKAEQLKKLANPHDISRLVVFDTWTLNCDRYCERPLGQEGKPRVNRNNVFLSEEAPSGQFMLKAMDHTHCFTCGGELTTRLRRDDKIKEPRVFGLFPEFRQFLDQDAVQHAVPALQKFNQTVIQEITGRIPDKWEVSAAIRKALDDLVVGRAAFVAETIFAKLWPQADLGFGDVQTDVDSNDATH